MSDHETEVDETKGMTTRSGGTKGKGSAAAPAPVGPGQPTVGDKTDKDKDKTDAKLIEQFKAMQAELEKVKLEREKAKEEAKRLEVRYEIVRKERADEQFQQALQNDYLRERTKNETMQEFMTQLLDQRAASAFRDDHSHSLYAPATKTEPTISERTSLMEAVNQLTQLAMSGRLGPAASAATTSKAEPIDEKSTTTKAANPVEIESDENQKQQGEHIDSSNDSDDDSSDSDSTESEPEEVATKKPSKIYQQGQLSY